MMRPFEVLTILLALAAPAVQGAPRWEINSTADGWRLLRDGTPSCIHGAHIPWYERLDALGLRTGNDDAAFRPGATGARVFMRFFEVEGEPVIDDNGTPSGTPARHGFSTNHRCDDVLRGVVCTPPRIAIPPTCEGYPDVDTYRDLECCLLAGEPDVRLDADFPGGNVRVVERAGDTFVVAPDLRDTKGWWFHFNFRLCAPPGRTATVVFAERNPIGARGPAASIDGGRTWTWMGREAVRKGARGGKPAWSFAAAVPEGAAEARFAFAPVYLETHFREWLDAHRTNAALRVTELCRSRGGRPVERVRAGRLDGGARGKVLLTARHHACESMASYALEGFLDAVLADDETGRRWRERWEVVAMPFADKDGVEAGDQGKNRDPHDHNRDYNATPLYPEIAAWMKLGESAKDTVVFSLDLHCPYIDGKWNDRVYIVGSERPDHAAEEKAFAAVLERERRGPLPFRAAECYLPAGEAWNKPGNYAAGRSNGAWARDTFSGARLAGAMEIAYADAQGVEVNAASARALGRDLASAALAYLGDSP